MVKVSFRQVIALSIAGSMFMSSTAAVAEPAAAPTQEIDPWAALSVLSAGAPAAALCGSATATAANTQPAGGCVLPAVDAAPGPVAQPIPAAFPIASPGPSLWVALGAIAAIVGGYFLVNGHKSRPVSPG
jgi:hypothetical protein